MRLSSREKELAAIAISVASGCKPCTDYHVKAARKSEASDDEIRAAVTRALALRRGATEIMESHALAHLGEQRAAPEMSGGEVDRVMGLVSIGATFALNCVSSLEAHLELGQKAGISRDEVRQIVKLAAFIKERAASHVERLAGLQDTAEVAEA